MDAWQDNDPGVLTAAKTLHYNTLWRWKGYIVASFCQSLYAVDKKYSVVNTILLPRWNVVENHMEN